MNLQIDPAQLGNLVSEALLRSLDENARETLIKSAIEFLTKAPAPGYGGKAQPTPLEEAFRNAISNVARTVALEFVTSDPSVQEKLRELLVEAVSRITTDERETTITRISNALIEGMTKTGY